MNNTTEFLNEINRICAAIQKGLELFSKIGDALDELETAAKSDGTLQLPALGEALFLTKNYYEDVDKQVKRVYHFQDMLNKHLLPERMKEQNSGGFRVPTIARSFSIVEKTSASFLDKEAGLEWLRKIGQGDMIQETVNAGTLAAFCRNMILNEGLEPPEDIIKVTTYSTTSMVKYRPKKGEL